jgi:FkbM family methyltransferase
MFVGETTWDAEERAAIGRALDKADRTRPFVFGDGGANVGMYSLSTIAQARAKSWPIRVVAIEPDPVNLARLRDNLAASAAHGGHGSPVALGAEPGTARLEMSATNRGEVKLSAAGTIEVPLQPLVAILKERGRITSMSSNSTSRASNCRC